jgi:uridine kinase
MELATLLANRIKASTSSHLVVGLCGRAGAGKSTLARLLGQGLEREGVEAVIYSGDWRFRMDSESRRRHIDESAREGLVKYLYTINQFGWWDFQRIYEDIVALREGKGVEIANAYDRSKGNNHIRIQLSAIRRGIIVLENAILGGVEFLKQLDVVVVVATPDRICLERCLQKDAHRRSLYEILARFLITSHSENLFLRTIGGSQGEILYCLDDGTLGGDIRLNEVKHLPVPLELLGEACRLLHGSFRDVSKNGVGYNEKG